jgi:hypothetical protein
VVTLAQVRSQIADRPQIYPPASGDPEIIGFGDGTATIFGLSFENFISGTLTVFFGTPGAPGVAMTFAAVSSTLYTVGTPSPGAATAATNQIITFAAPPATGTIVAARYQATAFSDTELQEYLTNAQLLYTDDRTVLKGVTFDLIDVILMDQRRLEMLAQGDYKRDAAAYAAGLIKLKESLRKDLTGDPLPGKSIPQIAFATNAANRYAPRV